MVADAIASCSGLPPSADEPEDPDDDPEDPDDEPTIPSISGAGPLRDGYLTYIRGRMQETLGSLAPDGNDLVRDWAQLRNEATLNCNPITGDNDAATIVVRTVPGRITAVPASLPNSLRRNIRTYAEQQLRNPGFQLCLAQTLREMLPGAAGAEALLLSEADQRALLEVVRERTQMAILDYAMLGVAFSTAYVPYGAAPPATANRYLPWLQLWALSEGTMEDPGFRPYDVLESMGRDFAAAVQLHTVATEELAALLARSRSARTPRGGDAATRVEELWGPGSFHQRFLAAMLGGDPLSGDASTPWEVPDPSVLPEDPNSYTWAYVFDLPGPPAASKSDGWDWPGDDRAPFVRTALREPQVHELFGLARRFDRIMLRIEKSATLCQGFWLTSGDELEDIYRWVEADLRREACWAVDPVTGECCHDPSTCTASTPVAPKWIDGRWLPIVNAWGSMAKVTRLL